MKSHIMQKKKNRSPLFQFYSNYYHFSPFLSLSLPIEANVKPLTFDEVYNQSSPTNCTVYCGGIGGNLAGELTEEILQKKFAPFGTIQEIRVFKDKGYAFVRFSTKEAATHAIVAIHNSEINQQTVKCSWGKESGDPNNVPAALAAGQALSPTGFPFGYGQQVGYWYPQAAAPTAYSTTPAAHLQSQWQGMQSYAAYGQFAGYQQAGYMGWAMKHSLFMLKVFECQSWWLILIDRMGASMQLPGAAAWVPQTPTQLTPASTPNSAMPQAIAYPTMQQFQVSPQVSLKFIHLSRCFGTSSTYTSLVETAAKLNFIILH